MSKVFIKRTRGLQKIEQVKSHAKYVGFRSKESKEKGFFSENEDNADYKSFLNLIEKNPALKHSQSIKAQKLLFSLRETDYTAYLRSGKSYKDLIRHTLKEYERRHGVKLAWIANVHNKNDHPHCHVIIMGVSCEKDSSGKFKRIFFSKDDFQQMKKDFDFALDRDSKYLLHEKFDMGRTINDIGKGFERVAEAIARDIDKTQKEAEYEKFRQLRKKSIENYRNGKKDKGRER